MEQTEQLEKLDQKLRENSESLHFARVPIRIKREFRDWATEEFCGDYGLAFKHLWEGRLDFVTISEEIGNIHARLAKLESAPQREQPKVRRMVGGRSFPQRS